MEEKIKWHKESIVKVLELLETSDLGLTSEEAKMRLERDGTNTLKEAPTPGHIAIFFDQFKSPLIYLLLIACAIVYLLGETVDAIIIMAVVFFNSVVGTLQEGRAQQTLRALKKFTETKATILRGGVELVIPDSELVKGDVLILREGEKVPADARVISVHSLQLDEAVITGESEPVFKVIEEVARKLTAITEARNLIFRGTSVVSGNGHAVVYATAGDTEIGRLAGAIAGMDTEIPLKRSIRHLSYGVVVFVFILSLLLFGLGTAMGESPRVMFATVVSLAVSVIPEGLPVVLTLVLATGVWRMSKRKALVKKMQAVEALGQATVIAVDKTGTITRNELVVRELYVGDETLAIEGIGYEPKGVVRRGEFLVDHMSDKNILRAGMISAFCAAAEIIRDEATGEWHVLGDPTEAALGVFGAKIGFSKLEVSSQLAEIPFDYKTKYHATLHKHEDKNIVTIVGAPEVILALSAYIWNGKEHDEVLSKERRTQIEATIDAMSGRGLRVLGCATLTLHKESLEHKDITDATFFCLYGLQDALRPEVKDAVRVAKEAGIRVAMITGDYPITARAIAKEAGIYKAGDQVLTGKEIEMLSIKEIAKLIGKTTVFARVTPEHKMRIIEAYKERDDTIAMTGDGVNDAPSLVAADLGVAMGVRGTEVAKEAADIVLMDDNFSTITAAIEEGRGIYITIKKVILYLFSTSLGEVGTIAGSIVLGYALPILPAQIIWLNFVIDGFLDISLAMEPQEKDLLKRKPIKRQFIIDRQMGSRMVLMASVMAVGALIVTAMYNDAESVKRYTMVLTLLAVFQWFNAWNCRSATQSLFTMSPFSNRFLIGATGIVIILQLLAVYTPLVQKFLNTTALTLGEWLFILAVASSIIVVEEIRKFVVRKRPSRS